MLKRAQKEFDRFCTNDRVRNVLNDRVKAATVCIFVLGLVSRGHFADFCVPFEWHGFPTFSDYLANHRRLDN